MPSHGMFLALAGDSLEAGLGHLWQLNGNSSDIFAPGTPSTDTSMAYGAGRISRCAIFNGTTSKVATPSIIKPSTWSVSCWIKPAASNIDTNGTVWFLGGSVVAGQCAYFERLPGSDIYQVFNGSSGTAPVYFTNNAWHHVACTYDGANVRCYVDGALAAGPSALAIAATTGTTTFGTLATVGDHHYAGSLDATAMWSRELTSGEVTALYNTGTGTEFLTGSLLTGLLHQWDFNGNSTDTVRPGAGTDTDVIYVAPKLGSACASLDGSTSIIQTAVDGPLGAAARTISCWYYNTDPGAGTLIAYGTPSSNHYFALTVGATSVSVYIGGTNICSATGVTANAWHHVVVTFDGTTTSLYVDGGTPTTATNALDTTHGSAYLSMGYGSTYSYITGLLDDTAMWNRALSAGEVASLYNTGSGVETLTGSLSTGLLHQWHFNGDSVDSVDGSGNGTDTAILYAGAPKMGSACATIPATTGRITTTIEGPLGNAPRTMACWFKQLVAGNRTLMGHGSGPLGCFDLLVYSNSLKLNINGNSGGGQACSVGSWHHAVVTHDGTNQRLYVDGVSLGPYSLVINTASGALKLGAGGDPAYQAGTLYVDQANMWNRALTPAEVLYLYNSGNGARYPY